MSINSGQSSLNLSGASNESVSNRKFNDIVIPNQNTIVSHIAVDIGGSMAKVVYFTTNKGHRGGRLNFEVFETDCIDKLIVFIESLIEKREIFTIDEAKFASNPKFKLASESGKNSQSTTSNPINQNFKFPNIDGENNQDNKQTLFEDSSDSSDFSYDSPTYTKPTIKATGGGAHLFRKKLEERLGVEVQVEDEMECLINGLNFFIEEVSDEVFVYKENDFPIFEKVQKKDMYPYIDMMVGDIYGTDYDKIGLKATAIASTMGGVYRKNLHKEYNDADIARSLLYMVSNNIGQIAYLNAQLHGIKRIYFAGYFIRGHTLTMHTLSYAINFWSKGTMNALFMRHEGFLGAVGAFIKADPTLLPDKPTRKGRMGSFTENFVVTQDLNGTNVSMIGIFDRASTKLLPLPQLIMQTSKEDSSEDLNSLTSTHRVYDPDTFDLVSDTELRNYWFEVMRKCTDNLIDLASSGKLNLNLPEDLSKLDKFKKIFSSRIQTLTVSPSAYGKLSVRSLLNLCEQCLHEIGFTDLYSKIKSIESESVIKTLPALFKEVDSITDKKVLVKTLLQRVVTGIK
ncbi:Pantothenate kinase 2 [Smittium culicis]|uniref:Pantothenate kinase 2 n=1 Tax=Smittium culicis TaxID=133412 RepID=A0A1R1XJY9_9FUNG|nr:Pantothenate kinase 2 [Smittium culicis]